MATLEAGYEGMAAFFGSSCISFQSAHECFCAGQRATHPILIAKDEDGNEHIQLFEKVFSEDEIALLKTVNGTWTDETTTEGQSSYEIFAAIDARTRNCEFMWTDEEVGVGYTYTGQYILNGSEMQYEGVGKLVKSEVLIWSST